MTPELIGQMRETTLFVEYLLPDILRGDVFPTERTRSFDFYYKGGNLFKFNADGQFQTHLKYASAILRADGTASGYVTEPEFEATQRIKDFCAGNARIKENCALYAGVERSGLYNLHKRSSYIRGGTHVILDIEIALTQKDFVDLLVYNTSTQRLHFFEAKHFSNSELWSAVGRRPRVVNQVERYNARFRERVEWLIRRYSVRIGHAQDLFGIKETDLPSPESVDTEVTLLLFGYDTNQSGKINSMLVDDGSLKGMKLRSKGSIEDSKFDAYALMRHIRYL